MTRVSVATVGTALGLMLASGLARGADPLAVAPTTRKAYVTVVDDKGQPVPGLTAADFAVKEGGKDREVASAEPATAKMRIALAFEETLAPLGGVRQGIFDFAQKMVAQAEIALVSVGISNRIVVPYTSDLSVLVAGINALPLSQRPQTNHVPEGVAELARAFVKAPAERPVIVMIALDSQQSSSEEPQNVLNILKDSNAQFHVVSIEAGGASGNPAMLMEMSGRAKVLGDGPKQAGGRLWPVNALTGVSAKGTMPIANDLSSQYLLTYVLPDGVKPSDRLSVTLKKKGATLRAPTRIADK
jgi:VWFA-related protein